MGAKFGEGMWAIDFYTRLLTNWIFDQMILYKFKVLGAVISNG